MSCQENPTIGNFAKVISGYAFKSKDFTDAGIPVVKIANIKHELVNLENAQYLPESFLSVPDRYHVRQGDVMISLTGSHVSQPNSVVGRVARYRQELVALLNQRAARIVITNPEALDQAFLYYFLRQKEITYALALNAGGAANQANISPTDVENVKLPPMQLDIQKRIAAILSAYDDLIENNRRRIALLEQAARLLYREWFVHFRFPGHETAKFVDGLPVGWTKPSIGEYCPFLYGKGLKADTRKAGDVEVYGSSGIVGKHNKKLVDGNAIVIGRKGNVGSVFWVKNNFWPIDTTYYVAPENSDLFTFYALEYVNFINTDVAVPGLNRNYAHSRLLAIPDSDLLVAFNKQAGLLMDQTNSLNNLSTKLTNARDLLLPRLMDGRISV